MLTASGPIPHNYTRTFRPSYARAVPNLRVWSDLVYNRHVHSSTAGSLILYTGTHSFPDCGHGARGWSRGRFVRSRLFYIVATPSPSRSRPAETGGGSGKGEKRKGAVYLFGSLALFFLSLSLSFFYWATALGSSGGTTSTKRRTGSTSLPVTMSTS